MPYDEHSRRTMLRSHPVAGRGRALRNPAGQLPGTVPAALETGSGTAHAFQPQVAVGAERIYRADHRCVRHTHVRASRGNATRRPGCDGVGLFYRKLLDGLKEVVFTNSIPLSEAAWISTRIKSLSIAKFLAAW